MNTQNGDPSDAGPTQTVDAKIEFSVPVRRDIINKSIGMRVRSARGEMSQRDLAAALHLHVNTLGKIERGDVAIDAALVVLISQITHVSAAWLLQGDLSAPGAAFHGSDIRREQSPPEVLMPAADVVPRSLDAVVQGDYIYVPHFNIQASAGPGFFNVVENVDAMRPFELGYVRNRLGIPHNQLALINIVGRSMEPFLHSGDVSMIDRRDSEANIEGVHVIRLDGALLVKSLQRMPGRVLRVSSKNQEYEPFDIKPDEDNQRDFEVLGRLRWAGITLN